MDGGFGEVFHIGTQQEISIGDLFDLIVELSGSQAQRTTDDARLRPEKSEVMRLLCNNTKLASASGFRPQTTLREGLLRTIEWFRDPAHLSRYKENIYNV
jgi:nucleoside-diphosphate-sugar epimerase